MLSALTHVIGSQPEIATWTGSGVRTEAIRRASRYAKTSSLCERRCMRIMGIGIKSCPTRLILRSNADLMMRAKLL